MLWKRIGLEDFEFPKVADYKKDYIKLENSLPPGVELIKITEDADDYFNIDGIQGLGDKFISFAKEFYNSGIALSLSRNTKIIAPIKIEFNIDDKNPIVIDKNIIIAESGSEITLVIDYSSSEKVEGFHNGLTVVYAKENSVVNIIKIQRMNDISCNFDSNIAFVEGQGKVNWLSVELGSNISGCNYTTFLEGEASESNLSSIYLGDGTRKMDLGYSMIHQGSRSISTIETKGVLKDKSRKVFRGNLDFKRGARHSKGTEEEYVILLDPTVKSDSIPALLCDEDDVEGEHAASAGQIDENRLFYLMSRGLDEREAKKLIIEASFRPVIDKIPLENLRKLISNEVDRRLIND
ncbi:iron-regulated ABC transporter permease protein SufD [Tissierella praeacuta]|uniref:Fe-S cluster assembly protein SufD n=1 Tax=Tissierella praeacuta TaxID=43131 RepID=UPI00104330D1|nr:Fe-S cluster assembly protein SufD [Tissierella praeacuta]TCU77200.1 iron-regulated ABC transporter permease protein SufD [Tissierella praeacuta]